MQLKWCQFDRARTATSSLTSRVLRVNETDKFYIPPDRTFEALPHILDSFERDHWSRMPYASKPRTEVLAHIRALADVRTFEQFAGSLDRVIDVVAALLKRGKNKSMGQAARLMDLLVRLHAEGYLAFPMQLPFATAVKYPRYVWSWGSNWTTYQEIAAAGDFSTKSKYHYYKALWITKLFLACCGAKDVGDLTPDVDGGLLFKSHGDAQVNNVPSAAKLLITMMRSKDPNRTVAFDPKDYGTNALPLRTDGTFQWATMADPSLDEWVKLLKRWLGEVKSAYVTNLHVANSFLSYLIENKDVTRNPLTYVRVGHVERLAYSDWLGQKRKPDTKSFSEYVNRLWSFTEWILVTFCSLDGVVSPEFRSPITRLQYASLGRNETYRQALPIHFIRMLKDILRAPYTLTGPVPGELIPKLEELKYTKDQSGRWVGQALPDSLKMKLEEGGVSIEYGFAWPKRQTDYFRFGLGGWEKTWSPVRTYFMLIKLELPLRSFQVRVLDSGEADAEIYDRTLGWIQNPVSLASSTRSTDSPATGVLRRMFDERVAEEFIGFFINTNKTSDQKKAQLDRGYEIPWHNREVIRLFAELMQWQRSFNPISRPLPWAEVTELGRRFRMEDLKKRGSACFLFRDPCGDNPEQPITKGRMERFWINLLSELESRVEAAGLRLKNGGKITFLEEKQSEGKRRSFKYWVPRYDLHSLRVSLITALAERGVPISILSKCIAGHATIIMTLYYAKFGPSHITDVMNEANKGFGEIEQQQFRRFLMDAAYQDVLAAAAVNDQVAIHALKKADPGAWVSDDRGICPTGCSRCSDGGDLKKAGGIGEQNVYGPVPGGQNCVLCRFFITGPAFLIGLNAHFNEIGWKIREASQRYNQYDQQLEALEAERYTCEAERRSFLRGDQLESVGKILQREGESLDVLGNTWHAIKRLMDRSLAIQAREDKGSRVSLVLAGTHRDVEAALEETTAFELADAVCQSAVLYESVDATMPNLRRADMINAMLDVNHRRPIFSTLSDEEKLRVGNEMAKFLFARVGREDALALMEGQETLERLELKKAGLAHDFDRLLEEETGHLLRVDHACVIEQERGVKLIERAAVDDMHASVRARND
jgi:hypothetical protein